MPDLQTLYDGVSKHVDLGMDYRAFHEAMRDSTRRRGFYDKVSPIVDIGDYETFNFKTQTYANESPRQVQPDQVGVTPPSPAEDSIPTTPDPDQVGDVWQRGLANMQRGFSDMFNLYDTWATKLEGALGITRGEETVLGVQRIGEDIFTDAEEWFRTKSDENIAEAAPATGIYAKPPENILGYLDPKKIYQTAGENVPLMGAFIASTIAHPGVGTALMFGVEGGSAQRSIDEFKVQGGVISPTLEYFTPVIVGAINAALERTGINRILRTAKVPGLKAKLTNIAVSSMVEGTTEGAQEIVQAIGEGTYHEIPNDLGERFIESVYAGLVLGLGGSTMSNLRGPKPTPVAPTPTAPVEEAIETTPEVVFPELAGTTPTLRYGQLNIKDEDVPFWKAEIERRTKEVEEGSRPVILERFQEKAGKLLSKGSSVFFGPAGAEYREYGEEKVTSFVKEGAKIYEGVGSLEFAVENELMNTEFASIKAITGLATLQEVQDNYDKGWDATDNPSDYYRAFQEVAETELKKQGYQGVHWLQEDDLSPEQFQIWDREILGTEKEFDTILTERGKTTTQLQLLKEALGAKLQVHLEYTSEGGFVEHPETDFHQDERFRAVYGMHAEDAINWAKTQIDADEWIQFFAGEGPAPVANEHNTGTDINEEILGDEITTSPQQTDEEIVYEKPKHIGWLAQHLQTPLFALKKKAKAMKDSFDVIRGELNLNHQMRDYEAWWKSLKHRLKKEDKEAVREAMDLAYLIKGENTQVSVMVQAQDKLAKLYAKYPRVQGVIEGRKGKGGIIELFEYVKKRYQESLREQARIKLSVEDNKIVDAVMENQKLPPSERVNTNQLVDKMVQDSYDVEAISRQEHDEKNGIGAWSVLPEGKRKRKRKSVLKRETTRIGKAVEEIRSIDDWGLRDYISNIELGSYRIIDADGRTLGFGRTAKEAKAKAFTIRKEKQEAGEEIARLRVEASVSPIKPTVKRKDVLAGEKDVFEVLPRYVYAMEKRTIMHPIIEQYKQNVKEDPEEYTGDVRNIIQTQIDYVMGARYSWGDRIADNISETFGWETGKYSKAVGSARKFIANTKLGYRPTAAFVNLMGGFGNTWVAVGNHFFVRARTVMRKGEYEAPDGEVIDFAAKLKELEETGSFGIDLAVGEGGTVSTRTSLWNPLGLFQLPEQFIRPHGFSANYLYQREALGKNDFEATEAALQNLYFQNFAYNVSAIPHILRSPSGKLIGQFKTYLVNQLQYLSTLRGPQIPRMVGLQLMMAGPRGVVYLLKSLPLLGAVGLLDDWEEWLVREKGTLADIATRGIGGVFGGDISAPATFQLPSRPEDWGGPALSEMIKFYEKVLMPNLQLGASKVSGVTEPAYVMDGVIDWVSGLSPAMYYWKDLFKSADGPLVWETLKQGELNKAARDLMKNLQKPNIWIKDSQGNNAYVVGGLQDRILLGLGAAPVAKSQMQVLRSIWQRNEKIRRENRSKWYNKVSKRLMDGLDVDESLWDDALLYRVDPSQLPTAIEFKEMSPQQRRTMRANLFEKAEAFDHFNVE